MHLGILTGGGDVPGLNPTIKAVVNEASARGWKVTGFRRGWAGPLNYNPEDPEGSQEWLMPLDPLVVRKIDRMGGTVLKTSRTKPSKARPKDLPEHLKSKYTFAEGQATIDTTDSILRSIEALKMDCLVAIGGDDTLSYASRLHQEGAPTMCIPKTMDNDVFGTDYCLGFSTCITRSVDLLTLLRTPAGSHERMLVVELFGRNSGESALIAGYLADADRTLIAEVPFDMERVAELMIEDRKRSPSNYAMLLVSEGAQMEGGRIIQSGEADAYGHQKLGGIGVMVAEQLKEITGVDYMNQSLAYLVRAGAPDSIDLMVGRNFGTKTIQLIEEGRMGLMVAIQDGKYVTQPADISTKGVRRVDVDAMYDAEQYRPRIKKISGMPMFLR